MSQPAATIARVRSATDPASAFMDTSSLINKPWNPITPRITRSIIVAEVVAGWAGSKALKTTCAVNAIGRPLSGRNAAKSVRSSSLLSVSTTGSRKWVSAVARPWPGICFRTGKIPPSSSPFVTAGDGGDLGRLGSIGPIADYYVGAGNRNVGERQAVHADAELTEIIGDQPGAQTRRLQPQRRIEVVEAAEDGASRIDRPMRRREALPPAALLVDQDRRVGLADGVSQFLNQRNNLSRGFNVPL